MRQHLKIHNLNKFAIETPNNKLQEVTLQDDSKELDYLPGTIMDYAPMHGYKKYQSQI